MSRRRAFTLIELLTVIAIIAILAAIILPVLARAKDNAYRNSDITNMNAIRAALQLYRVDQGGYPPALLGYATLYTSGPNVGNVVPADQLKAFLYPKRIDSISTLRPAYNRLPAVQISGAVWPNADPRAVGSAPILDLDGNGNITPLDDIAGARQEFGPTQAVQHIDSNPASPTFGTCVDTTLYAVSGYDLSKVPLPGGGDRFELRYTLFWTSWGFGACGVGPGNASDDPRQLGYDDPPDGTIITWNSYFRDWTNGVPPHNKRDLALMIGGGARPADSKDMYDRSWRHQP